MKLKQAGMRPACPLRMRVSLLHLFGRGGERAVLDHFDEGIFSGSPLALK
jgi:hypothetical protein